MIVLNGEPFTRYNLRSIYPWADQIIVVEGACEGAASSATPDGHSVDDTLQIIRRFQEEEDPHKKVVLITAEDEGHPNGFWPEEKDEMSRAYARRATGNVLWQIDSDEFYLESDMPKIIDLLRQGYDAIEFKQICFWGALYCASDGYRLRDGAEKFRRVFAWGPGFQYSSHRPPTVLNQNGEDLFTKNVLFSEDVSKHGVYLYHYSLLFPKQVLRKQSYYKNAAHAKQEDAESWAEEAYLNSIRPFDIDNIPGQPSWLFRFQGSHPSQAELMFADVSSGAVAGVQLRQTKDIDALLGSGQYRMRIAVLKASYQVTRKSAHIWLSAKPFLFLALKKFKVYGAMRSAWRNSKVKSKA